MFVSNLLQYVKETDVQTVYELENPKTRFEAGEPKLYGFSDAFVEHSD